MTLHGSPYGSSWPSNKPPIKSSGESSGASFGSYNKSQTQRHNQPIEKHSGYWTGFPNSKQLDPNVLKAECAKIFDQFDQGQLISAQTMAEDLVNRYPFMPIKDSAPIYSMLGLYPFGLDHADRACRIYKILYSRDPSFKVAYQNAEDSLTKAREVEALWEAQEKKKRGTYTKDQILLERYESFYYSVFKHNRKEGSKTLVDSLLQPSSKSPSSKSAPSNSESSFDSTIPLKPASYWGMAKDSTGSQETSVMMDAKWRAKKYLELCPDRETLIHALNEDARARYESQTKMQRKMSSWNVDAKSKGKSVQRDAVQMSTEDAQEPTIEQSHLEKLNTLNTQRLKAFYDKLHQHAKKCTVNGTVTAGPIPMVSEPSTSRNGDTEKTNSHTTDDDEQIEKSGSDRYTDVPTMAGILYRAQLRAKSRPETNGTAPKRPETNGTAPKTSAYKVVPTWDYYNPGNYCL